MNKDIKSMIKDEMEKYRDEDRRLEAGICIVGEARKDREITEPSWHPDGVTFKEKYEKERKLRQEAEGETTIVKGVGMNSPEMKEAIRTIKNLEIRLAESLEVNEAHQKLNGKLQERLTEVEEDNKKMHDVLSKRINNMRKSGM